MSLCLLSLKPLSFKSFYDTNRMKAPKLYKAPSTLKYRAYNCIKTMVWIFYATIYLTSVSSWNFLCWRGCSLRGKPAKKNKLGLKICNKIFHGPICYTYYILFVHIPPSQGRLWSFKYMIDPFVLPGNQQFIYMQDSNDDVYIYQV